CDPWQGGAKVSLLLRPGDWMQRVVARLLQSACVIPMQNITHWLQAPMEHSNFPRRLKCSRIRLKPFNSGSLDNCRDEHYSTRNPEACVWVPSILCPMPSAMSDQRMTLKPSRKH
ncbi:hypothetical protein PSHT_02594, partial [Puccinia striiformis]